MTLPARTRIPSHRGLFVLLRRLRAPLALLIIAYAIAVWGFTLMPGQTPDGKPWQMSFFHAFYVVSIIGTTIGLGEVPYAFSDAQRQWCIFAIYLTVIAWLYAIGVLFATLQDPQLRRVLAESRFAARVRAQRQPFWLLCGYDDAGVRVARELSEAGMQLVLVDNDALRVDAIDVDQLPLAIPALHADAIDPHALLLAGIAHPRCAGVIALTGSDAVNINIALAARLLKPDSTVICGARLHSRQAEMAVAGADHIINPFDTFAERLAHAIQMPSLLVIYEALTTQSGTAMAEVKVPPRGRWIVCGYGRFGRTVHRHLQRIGIEVTVIEERPQANAPDGHVARSPTEAAAWREAGIDKAQAVCICGGSDTENLLAVLQAHQLNPGVFIAARQNQRRHAPMFDAAPITLRALSGHVLAAEVLRIIRAPQLSYFLRLARQQDEDWANALLQRMRRLVGAHIVEVWSLRLSPAEAPSVVAALRAGRALRIRDLLAAPEDRALRLEAVPLLLQRAKDKLLLPADDDALAEGDRLLVCGRDVAEWQMRRTAADDTVLAYVLDGIDSNRRVPWPALTARSTGAAVDAKLW